MPGGAWGATEGQRRAMAGTRDFLSRVHARMRPRKHHDATDEERKKSGRRIRVGRGRHLPTLRRVARRPVFSVLSVMALSYVSVIGSAALLAALYALTDQRHPWLRKMSEFLWWTMASPYGLLPLLIPVLFFICMFVALRSSFDKTPAPEVPDELRHTKLVTRLPKAGSPPAPTQGQDDQSGAATAADLAD